MDRKVTGWTLQATPSTNRCPAGKNIHNCPHFLLSSCHLLTLGHLMSKFLLLCCHMSSLHSMLGLCYLLLLHPCKTLCQCQIPLLLPLLLLLLVLIRIWIIVLLRMIGDQKLCYGFMLEIVGHDGVQDSALRLPWGYILGNPEKSSQGSHGALTLRGGHCHDPQHVLEFARLTSHSPRPDT